MVAFRLKCSDSVFCVSKFHHDFHQIPHIVQSSLSWDNFRLIWSIARFLCDSRVSCKILESVAESSVRATLIRVLPPGECYWLVNASRPNYRYVARFSMGLNYGPIFRRLWTEVHPIMSADAREIVVCNAVFRLSISCSVPEIFAIEVRRRPKSRRKKHVFHPIILGGGPQMLDLVFTRATLC